MKTLIALIATLALAGSLWAWRTANGELEMARRTVRARDSVVTVRDHDLDAAGMVAETLTQIEGELARIRSMPASKAIQVGKAESPEAGRRQLAVARIRALSGWLDHQRAALVRAAAQNAKFDKEKGRLQAEVDNRIKMIEGLQTLADRQRREIDELTKRLGVLESENRRLAETVVALKDAAAKVFVVAGTRQELLARGVVVQEGGIKLPFTGRELTALVPARVLKDSVFTRLNRDADTVLTLPKKDHYYRVVSRHDPALLAGANGPVSLLKGSAKITAPAAFWRSSSYLILEEIPLDAEVWR